MIEDRQITFITIAPPDDAPFAELDAEPAVWRDLTRSMLDARPLNGDLGFIASAPLGPDDHYIMSSLGAPLVSGDVRAFLEGCPAPGTVMFTEVSVAADDTAPTSRFIVQIDTPPQPLLDVGRSEVMPNGVPRRYRLVPEAAEFELIVLPDGNVDFALRDDVAARFLANFPRLLRSATVGC